MLMKMQSFVPPHPGEFIKEVYLTPFNISAGTVAEKLKVSPSTFNRLVNKESNISPEMALRLSKTLGIHQRAGLQYVTGHPVFEDIKL